MQGYCFRALQQDLPAVLLGDSAQGRLNRAEDIDASEFRRLGCPASAAGLTQLHGMPLRFFRVFADNSQLNHARKRRVSQGFAELDLLLVKGRDILCPGGLNREMLGIECLQDDSADQIPSPGAAGYLGQ